MANPLFNAMGGRQTANPMNFVNQFPQFMQQMRGKNPSEIINNLVSSGKINQQQLDAAQQQAQQMSGIFEGFRGMFR